MRLIADFHLHSAFSRATSRDMHLPVITRWGRWKGLSLLGTGDFTHPVYFQEIQEELEETGDGLLRLKTGEANDPRFILTAETSHIYTQGGRGRRLHMMIFAPGISAAQKINLRLARLGNISSDGRPIFGFSAKDLVKVVLDTEPTCLLVPAHAWTPWFSVFGSHSGFDSLEECFEEETVHIRAIETGLSSDPAMNRRWSALDPLALISNSDAQSPAKIGREANILETERSYPAIIAALTSGDPSRFLGTVEFFPEEGKYHFDGHRDCRVCFSPEQTRQHAQICPVCGKKLVIGVLHRVEELADRPPGFTLSGAVPARHLVPLEEIIAEFFGLKGPSRRVRQEYLRFIEKGGSEFQILLDLTAEELRSFMEAGLVEGILRVRTGAVTPRPGYDGVYGQVKVFTPELPSSVPAAPADGGQLSLF
ncbi:MAG: DNA helicase UvrD [Deltaproteobacteria bacterium]|nr:DNA helicase UvrD [Deltaproteobacteria bacterium]